MSITIIKTETTPNLPVREISPWVGVVSHPEQTMATAHLEVEVLTSHMSPLGGVIGPGGRYFVPRQTALQLVGRNLVRLVEPEPPAEPAQPAPWLHQLSPDEYLQKFPDGENAEQARTLLAAQSLPPADSDPPLDEKKKPKAG